MSAVKIYEVTFFETWMMDEQGSGFSLYPFGENTKYYKGYDDGGKLYYLPENYELTETQYGEIAIYNHQGNHCEIDNFNHIPFLFDPDLKEKFPFELKLIK